MERISVAVMDSSEVKPRLSGLFTNLKNSPDNRESGVNRNWPDSSSKQYLIYRIMYGCFQRKVYPQTAKIATFLTI